MVGLVWRLSQPTLSTFPVGGNRSIQSKPTSFGRALTDSFHTSTTSQIQGKHIRAHGSKARQANKETGTRRNYCSTIFRNKLNWHKARN